MPTQNKKPLSLWKCLKCHHLGKSHLKGPCTAFKATGKICGCEKYE